MLKVYAGASPPQERVDERQTDEALDELDAAMRQLVASPIVWDAPAMATVLALYLEIKGSAEHEMLVAAGLRKLAQCIGPA